MLSSLIQKAAAIFLGAGQPLECVQIEMTSECGCACRYCPRAAQAASWRARRMRPETFRALLPLLRESRRAHLQGWGEPLLHPGFFEYQKLARDAGCLTSTTTSGMFPGADIPARLAASGMDVIAFSLAGVDAATNAIRARAPFDDVCASIRRLQGAIKDLNPAEPPQINIAYLLLADRMEAVLDLPELLDRLDVPAAVVSALDYIARPDQRSLALLQHESDKIERARELLEQAAAKAERLGRVLHHELPQVESYGAAACREDIGRTLYIDAEGRISPCIYLNVPGSDAEAQRRVFGSCVEDDPWRVWRNEDYALFRRRLAENLPDEVCRACPKRFAR